MKSVSSFATIVRSIRRPLPTLVFAVAIHVGSVSSVLAQRVIAPGYPENVLDYDPREIALLPRYCLYTQSFRDRVPGGNDPFEIARWSSTLGITFQHLHHYCWGLMKTNRALMLARTEQTRRSYLSDAIGEFDYAIDRSPTDFPLLPEMVTRKGQNLLQLGRAELGIEMLERAIQLKSDYWAPYAYLSDYYKESGHVSKAKEVLQQGLSLSPDAIGLKRRLAELNQAKEERVQ